MGGWNYGNNYGLSLALSPTSPVYGGTANCSVPSSYLWYQLSAIFPDGSSHILHLMGASDNQGNGYYQALPGAGTPPCGTYSGDYTYFTNDGTYVKVVIGANSGNPNCPVYTPAFCWTTYTWTMYFPDGTQVVGAGSQTISITDRNGNQILVKNVDTDLGPGDVQTLQYLFQDAFGRGISVLHELGTGFAWTDIVSQTGVNGSSMSWTVQGTLQQLSGTLTYPCNGPTACQNGAIHFPAVTQIAFPANGAGYQPIYKFTYNTSNWGQLSGVTLPSGATVQYVYTYDGQNSYSMSPPSNPVASKSVNWCDETDLGRPVQPGTSCSSAGGTLRTDTWTYSFGATSSSVTGPDNGRTTRYFPSVALVQSGLSAGTLLGGPNAGLVYETRAPDGSTVQQQWANATPAESSLPTGNPFVQYSIRWAAAGGSPSLAAVSAFQYDLNGNLTNEADNDFVSTIPFNEGVPPNLTTAPGTTLRATNQTFVNSPTGITDPNAYWNESSPAIRNEMSCHVTAGDLNGSTSTFAYDGYGNVTTELDWDSTTSSSPQSTPSCPATLTAEPAGGGSGNALSTIKTWAYGNLTSVTDPRGNTTNFTYDSNSLYLTQISGTGSPGTIAYSYDFNSGLPLAKTDYNGLTTANTYDNLGRVAQTIQSGPSGLLHMTSTTFDDINRRVATFDDNVTPGDQQIISVTDYDQLGRQRLGRVLESGGWTPSSDDTAGIKTQTRYLYNSSLGHGYQLVSNPYRASTSSQATSGTDQYTMGWTMTTLDQNGQPIQIQAFGGALAPGPFGMTNPTGNQATTICYSTSTSGTCNSSAPGTVQTVTVTDPNNVQRVKALNGLGWLTSVNEAGIGQTTIYGYDSLGNLWTVTPSGYGTTACTSPQSVSVTANRGFIYDSLGRLQTACNPESGTTNYAYDQNGNLSSRKDMRGSMLCYGTISNNVCSPNYDAFNRPTQKTYNDNATPPACYSYYSGQDFLQTASTMTVNGSCAGSAVNSYTWSNYDALGRPGTGVEYVSGQGSWTFSSVVWTPQGQVSSVTYPSGRIVQTQFDSTGRPTLVSGSLNGSRTNYVGGTSQSPTTYYAHGAVQQATLGDNVPRTYNYNSFLQMTQAQAGSLMTVGLGYSTTNNNNGTVLSQHISQGAFNVYQGYWYDGGNRLCVAIEAVSQPGVGNCAATVTPANWSQWYNVDNVGNRTLAANSSPLSPPDYTPTQSNAFNSKNQWTGAMGMITPGYDAAGNFTSLAISGQASEGMGFDAESRMTCWVSGSTTCSSNATVTLSYDAMGRRVTKTTSTTGTTVYIYDLAGNLAVEWGGAQIPTQTLYVTQDHLGSTRLVTNASGGVVGCHDYAPFGEEIPASYGSRPSCYGQAETQVKFTGQERDPETALDLNGFDNFQARMLAGTMGRFLSPDPDNAGADPAIPQTWNMYGYVGNDPFDFVDPTGLQDCPLPLCFTSNPVLLQRNWDPENYLIGLQSIWDLARGNPIGGPIYNWSTASSNVPSFLLVNSSNVTQPSYLTTIVNGVKALFGYDSSVPAPSCFEFAIKSTLDHLNPLTPDASNLSEGAGTVYTAVKFNQALKYAASKPSSKFGTRFLMYPNKSKVFAKTMKSAGKGAAASAWMSIDISLLEGVIDEYHLIKQGGCQ
jgi:RHS repeat-associated protein